MVEVTDGLSNTLGVIEAGPPVPWTKPADLVYDARKPVPVMTGPYSNVRHAGLLDGSAVALRARLDESAWRRLIDPNDGEQLPDWKNLRARFLADSADEKKELAKVLAENAELIAAVEAQLREHAALLQLSKDGEGAAEQSEELKEMLKALKARNRKLREELGVRPGGPPEAPKRP
jgi:hypothetical protein